MSLRLASLNLHLRLFEKPVLARLRDPLVAREQLARKSRRLNRSMPPAHVLQDRIVGEDREIPIEWVSRGRPDRRRVILYLHGGAFIMGSPETHRRTTAALSEAAGARVAVPDYALSPENPFPAAIHDVTDVYRSLIAAGYQNIALAGDSAGGGLCFSLLQEIERLDLPKPSAIAAFSPWVDLTMQSASLMRNRHRDPMLPVSQFRRVAEYYLDGHTPEDPLASPVFATWADPPPTLIQASRIEILEDAARKIAEGLRAGGGDVRLEWSSRAPHAWQFFVNYLPEADAAVRRAGEFLAKRMARSDEASESADDSVEVHPENSDGAGS